MPCRHHKYEVRGQCDYKEDECKAAQKGENGRTLHGYHSSVSSVVAPCHVNNSSSSLTPELGNLLCYSFLPYSLTLPRYLSLVRFPLYHVFDEF
jgi:hypothetical protein